MVEFENSSYLAQVRRLRSLGEAALEQYAIGKTQVHFINHGENTTFRVDSERGRFLLRIHRRNYHTEAAIREELHWIADLAKKTDIPLPVPQKTRHGALTVKLAVKGFSEPRVCNLLTWQHGRLRSKSLGRADFFEVGHLIGQMHVAAKSFRVRQRNYWRVEGFLGSESKFGAIDNMRKGLPLRKYKILTSCRQMLVRRLNSYAKVNSSKMSMIHADLHFGNIIWGKRRGQPQIMPIDFDDCGYGFHMMDLATTLFSAGRVFNRLSKKQANEMIETLLLGYSTHCHLSSEDIKVIPYFIEARRIALAGWLYSRQDNPVLKKHFEQSINDRLRGFAKTLKNGPAPLFY